MKSRSMRVIKNTKPVHKLYLPGQCSSQGFFKYCFGWPSEKQIATHFLQNFIVKPQFRGYNEQSRSQGCACPPELNQKGNSNITINFQWNSLLCNSLYMYYEATGIAEMIEDEAADLSRECIDCIELYLPETSKSNVRVNLSTRTTKSFVLLLRTSIIYVQF